MSEKTIALTGAETEVHFSGGNAWLRNDGAAVVYAAKTAGVAGGADGVISIPAGGSAPVYGANGTVFLLGAGEVLLIGSDYATNPFVGDSFGGGADIVANAAEMVTLDGLQGGVPFSDITVSGKNLCDYPYGHGSPVTWSGVTFIMNDDGSVTANGTVPDGKLAIYGIFMSADPKLLPAGTYTISGCPKQSEDNKNENLIIAANVAGARLASDVGEGATFTLKEPTYIVMRLYVGAGNTANDLVFYPQLERGGTVTEYEPPIGSQEITLTANGTEYSIIPDSNPYTVPNEIRQQDGINNVSVYAGEVSVTGVKRNATIKKIWDKLDELTAAIIVSNGETAE